MPRRDRCHVRQEETDRDASERVDSELYRITENWLTRRNSDRCAAPKSKWAIGAGNDGGPLVCQRDMGVADRYRTITVLVREHDA